MKEVFSVDLRDWNVSYTDLINWSKESGIDIWGVNAYGGNGAKIYIFNRAEDLTAFKLRFSASPTKQRISDFFDTGSPDTNYF